MLIVVIGTLNTHYSSSYGLHTCILCMHDGISMYFFLKRASNTEDVLLSVTMQSEPRITALS